VGVAHQEKPNRKSRRRKTKRGSWHGKQKTHFTPGGCLKRRRPLLGGGNGKRRGRLRREDAKGVELGGDKTLEQARS